MNVWDLIKATVICAGIAYLAFSFPVFGQVVIIGFLSLMWLSCAHMTVQTIRRRRCQV